MTLNVLKKMQETLLAEGQEVRVFGFGDNKTYPGIVRGKSSDGVIPIYIIEMNYPGYPYSCATVPASCILECNDEKNG